MNKNEFKTESYTHNITNALLQERLSLTTGHEYNYFSLSTDLYSKETITMAALDDQDYCQWIHRRE